MKNARSVQRINAYLGRAAVAQLKFSQGALPVRPPPPVAQKAAGPLPSGDPSRRYQGPDGVARPCRRWREGERSSER